jgi:uncharacterized membrane protein
MSDSVRPLALAIGKNNRIVSIDLLRGIVIVLMALDHVRDYFHGYSYLYDPVDLDHTSVPIFFTRWISHFCAPVFMFLAGISACLYGEKRGRKELSFFLFTRGLWLVLAELFIVTLEWTFNPFYSIFILQVIWAIGVSMIVLSGLIYFNRRLLLLIGILLIGAHNLLDGVHVSGKTLSAVIWSLVHEPQFFNFTHFAFFVGYPLLPWIGILVTGYCLGGLYASGYDPAKRKRTLFAIGVAAILLFILLRVSNVYGDPSYWSGQKNAVFTFLSFLRTTKYPPSLQYILMTLGPSLIFLSFAERPLNGFTEMISTFGRVAMFYYLVHILVIHLAAVIAAQVSGHNWLDMVFLKTWVTSNPRLKGYGFNLITVYLVWIGTLIALYPLCKWYDGYKRRNQSQRRWLSYI